MRAEGATKLNRDFNRLPTRFPSLDGVRGIAILLVLIHQLGMLEVAPGAVDYVFKYVMGTGWVGVQLFFVLSGFLITGILLDTRATDDYFRSFYMRRCLRILPLYYGVLLLAFVVLPLADAVPHRVADSQPYQWMFWLFLSNWGALFGADSGLFPHFWSLAVEEQFYLLWPLLLWNSTAQRALKLCMFVALAALAARAAMVWHGMASTEIYEFTICRMDALALGGALAAAMRVDSWRQRLLSMPGRWLLASVVVALVGALVSRRYANYLVDGELWGYSFLAASFALLIGAAVTSDVQSGRQLLGWLKSDVMRSLGKYSFAMYVFHKPLHELVGRPVVASLGWPVTSSTAYNVLYIGAGITVLWVAAMVSYHAYEKFFLRLKTVGVPHTPA